TKEEAGAEDAEGQASRPARASHRAALRARHAKRKAQAELPAFEVPPGFLDENVFRYEGRGEGVKKASIFREEPVAGAVEGWARLAEKSGKKGEYRFSELEEDPRFFAHLDEMFFESFEVLFRHSAWTEGDVSAALENELKGVEERSRMVTLGAALACYGWMLDNPRFEHSGLKDFAAVVGDLMKSATPSDLEAVSPRDIWRRGLGYSNPLELLPEVNRKPTYYRDLTQAVGADLEAKPPKHYNINDLKRPINVVNVSSYSGSRISTLLMRFVATANKADVLRLDSMMLSRIVGGYLGQDWAYSRGPMSMMGFRVAELNSVLGEPIQWPIKRDEDDDPEATVVHVGTEHDDSDYKDPMDRELSKIRDNAKDYVLPSVDRWENLKINAALEGMINAALEKSPSPGRKLIIQVDDFVELGMTLEGALLLGRLRNIIDGMWLQGKQIALVGTSSSMELSDKHLTALREIAMEDSVTAVPAVRNNLGFDIEIYEELDFLSVNMQNIYNMWDMMTGDADKTVNPYNLRFHSLWYHTVLHHLSTTGVVAAKLFTADEKGLLTSHVQVMETVVREMLETYAKPLRASVLPPTELYHCVRHALHQKPAREDVMRVVNEAQMFRGMSIDSTNDALGAKPAHPSGPPSPGGGGGSNATKTPGEKSEVHSPKRLAETLGITDEHEKKLLGGLIDKDQIRTTFADVHAPEETTAALKLLTSLSLKRPEAFTYGVLARDRIPGCLLYGPPGTGKTLLAKAVAKESGASVLEVSAATINEMWVGQGEKNVQALFSLAKKLEPLVIFIDEADALLAGRGSNERRAHREIINQFLREWDGMSDTNAFIMVATNRPFDLDEAVLRRLPRRILVDLPQQSDRLAILKIMLRDEKISESVDLEELARRTPLYSGSDLKNMCVAAAMATVREETEAALKSSAETPSYPERRTIEARHFETGMREIGASISDEMESMREIRKFDETYGKPGGKKAKKGMGFHVGKEEEGVKEARVRA
ncbi:MAG: ATP-binding protein, partial [Acidobacteria bacterium]|nr:ATP-binding protein [Acidobacteriota bacterium]